MIGVLPSVRSASNFGLEIFKLVSSVPKRPGQIFVNFRGECQQRGIACEGEGVEEHGTETAKLRILPALEPPDKACA